MKKLIFLLSVLVLPLFLLAQVEQYQPKWSTIHKKEKRFSNLSAIGMVGDFYYIQESSLSEVYLYKYKVKNNKFISKKASKVGKKSATLLKIIKTAKGHFGIFSVQDTKEDTRTFYRSKLKRGNFGKKEKILEYNIPMRKVTILGIQKIPDYRLTFRTNGAGSKVLISGFKEVDKTIKKFYSVFDDEMNLLWEHKEDLESKDGNEYNFESLAINNKGNVLNLVNQINKNRKLLGGHKKSIKVCEVLYINQEGATRQKISIDKSIASNQIAAHFHKDDRENYSLIGFYSENKKLEAAGTFSIEGHVENGVNPPQFKPFLKLSNEEETDKEEEINDNYSIKSTFEMGNGNIGFIAEDYFSTTHHSNNNENVTHSSGYSTNDIVVCFFNKEGDFLKKVVIDKSYTSGEYSLISYVDILSQGKLYFVFNDKKSKKERKALKGKKSIYTDIAIVNENGELILQENLTNARKNEHRMPIFVSSLSIMEEGYIILLCYISGKKYSVGLMNLSN